MKRSNLTELVLLAREGSLVALDEIYKQFIPLINHEGNRIFSRVRDSTSFEFECYKKIESWVRDFDENVHNDFRALIIRCIRRIKSKHLKNELKVVPISLDSLAGVDDEGNQLHYERYLVDDNINLAEDIIDSYDLTEKVTVLANGDSRKMLILKAWINGYNDSEIAKLLAKVCGGNSESHRKFITRFKNKECRTAFEKTA
ncbi:hypothetical protein [Alkalihalobacillus pseudalcaliphilus]|uniref:hypothetical protein n=1 Tax=Alkalihalobacillus pseudalcaliphilus TaxID=79884 RepID=UPI00064DCC49|nr:hypothetical protein [Alkalihalobacillus pseudalcaliphilus]KMK75416.1 hypothetical protein AB990_08850 [Alkalihalobacillus pseudalcaliphilus]